MSLWLDRTVWMWCTWCTERTIISNRIDALHRCICRRNDFVQISYTHRHHHHLNWGSVKHVTSNLIIKITDTRFWFFSVTKLLEIKFSWFRLSDQHHKLPPWGSLSFRCRQRATAQSHCACCNENSFRFASHSLVSCFLSFDSRQGATLLQVNVGPHYWCHIGLRAQRHSSSPVFTFETFRSVAFWWGEESLAEQTFWPPLTWLGQLGWHWRPEASAESG